MSRVRRCVKQNEDEMDTLLTLQWYCLEGLRGSMIAAKLFSWCSEPSRTISPDA
jgi:hypothetical protein